MNPVAPPATFMERYGQGRIVQAAAHGGRRAEKFHLSVPLLGLLQVPQKLQVLLVQFLPLVQVVHGVDVRQDHSPLLG